MCPYTISRSDDLRIPIPQFESADETITQWLAVQVRREAPLHSVPAQAHLFVGTLLLTLRYISVSSFRQACPCIRNVLTSTR